MRWIRGGLWALVMAAAGGGLVACATPEATRPVAPVTISLIGINDFHGQLLPGNGSAPVLKPGSDTVEKVPAGGAAYLAALVNRLRAENPGNTVLVAAGDLVGASPLVSSLFHDEPTIEVLNRLGLAVSAVGNHEFEKGRDELLRLQQGGCYPPSADGLLGVVGSDTCMTDGRFEGAKFRYLGANVIDRRSGRPLLPATLVREIGGVKVGFVGVVLKETPATLPSKWVEGLEFADEVETINASVPELRRQGVAFVVALLHQGAETRARAINDPTCPGVTGAALRIVDRLDPAVQVVITGHTHEEYVCRRPDGRLMTQAGQYGRLATKIDIRVDPVSGAVLGKSARTAVAANDGTAGIDADVDAIVRRYAALTARRSETIVGRLAGPLVRAANYAGERPLGNVLADAYLFGGSDGMPSAQAAQIAFVNPGGIRAELTRGLEVSFGQLYSVHPFGNTLITLALSGDQLRRVLEQQWESPQPQSGNVLSVSAGFSYRWDISQPGGAVSGQGRRIVPGSMRLHGVAIDPGQVYRVTVNSFLASGGDNFSVFTEGRKLAESEKDIDVLMAYFRSRGVLAVPALDRIGRVP